MKIQKTCYDIYYKTLIIGVKLLWLAKVNFLCWALKWYCLLRLFSTENWVPHKSLVSTIWIREITWGKTSFFGITNIYQIYDHKNTFTEPLWKSRFWPLLWKRYCTDLSSFSPLNIQCIVDFSLKQWVKQVIYGSKI